MEGALVKIQYSARMICTSDLTVNRDARSCLTLAQDKNTLHYCSCLGFCLIFKNDLSVKDRINRTGFEYLCGRDRQEVL